MNKLDKFYRLPSKQFWNGRVSSKDNPNEYWHENIFIDKGIGNINSMSDVGILGYVCDEGVKRNNGRKGAVDGPKSIREQLGKLSFHTEKNVSDYGDVICVDNNMENTQEVFSNITKKIVEAGQLSIGIGGGHDLAYGHFCGIKKALKKSKIGIINFDAHFDLRPPNKKSNSGTPFHQILNKFNNQVNYLPVGIQKFSNPESLYKIASKFKIDYVPIEDCTLNNMNNIFILVDNFIKESEFIYLSIDLDGFASCHAPGVSAPGPFGFSVEFFRILFKYILKTKKVVAIDIVELNPLYDIDSRTAKLAAHIINMAVTK